MPDEFPQGAGSLDDSTPPTGEPTTDNAVDANAQVADAGAVNDGWTQTADGGWQHQDGTRLDAEGNLVPPDTAPATPAAPVATAPTAPQTPAEPTGYQAPTPIGMSDGLRKDLAEYLPEELVNRLGDEMRQVAVTASQQAIIGRDAQEQVAAELNIPTSYLPSVRRYLPQTQQAIGDPKQAVQAAIMMDLHERAARSGDLIGEMQRYVQAATGNAAPVVPTTPPPAPPKARVQPLHPDAQPTRPAIQGAPVRTPAPPQRRAASEPADEDAGIFSFYGRKS